MLMENKRYYNCVLSSAMYSSRCLSVSVSVYVCMYVCKKKKKKGIIIIMVVIAFVHNLGKRWQTSFLVP